MKTTLYYPLALLLVSIVYASPLAAQSNWPIDSTLFDVARNLREQEFFSDVAY